MPKAATKKSSPTKTKAKKDPNAPKKPLSAFMFFSQENRQRVKDENPDATFGEMGKLLGAAWKDIKDADKKKYTEMAEKDKARYEKAVAEYKPKKEEEDAE